MEFVQIARWLAVLAALWGVGLPVAGRLFPRFPDGGGSLALPVAMVGLLAPVYWVGQVSFGPATVAVGLLVLLAASLAVGNAGGIGRRPTAEAVVVFLAAFGLLLAVRAAAPDVIAAGGEKLLDYGLLNGIIRSGALPPEDVWFAGEEVRYYYGGHLLTAVLTTASGVRPPVAYNLAVATFYATLVTAVYGLAGAVADARGVSRRRAGVCGAFLVGLAGNLATPGRFLLGLLPESLAARYGGFLLEALVMDYGTALDVATDPSGYWFWRARTVVPDAPTVFPMWSFLNGDLRPHMVGATFLVLAAALGFAYSRTPGGERSRRRLLVVGAAGAVGGHLALVNTWDLPTTLGLVFLAVIFGEADPRSLLPPRVDDRIDRVLDRVSLPDTVDRELGRAVGAGTVTLGTATVAVAWVAPFLLFRTAENRGVGLFPPLSPVEGLVLVYGVFLAVFAVYLGPRLPSSVRAITGASDRRPVEAVIRPGDGGRPIAASLAGLSVAVVGVAVLNLESVLLLSAVLVAAWSLLARDGDVGYETVLFVAGLGLLLVAEVAYARVYPYDPNAPRWNTVYKVSMQVWILWGIAGGVAATDVVARGVATIRRRIQFRRWMPFDGGSADDVGGAEGGTRTRDWLRILGAVAVVLSLVAAGTFPAVALDSRFEGSPDGPVTGWSLDGTGHVDSDRGDEAAAMAWLRDRDGRPTLVTHPGDAYTWSTAPASLTGLPTVVGWQHVAGYHGRDAYDRRVRDVRAIYTGNVSAAVDALDAHDVDYVYVGPVECRAYAGVSFRGIDGVEVAYRSGSVTIYSVDQGRLGVDEGVPDSHRFLGGEAC